MFSRFLTCMLVAMTLGAGCNGTRGQDPDDPSKQPAPKITCREVRERALPLVTALPEHEQEVLEQTMNNGVAVVRYTCDRIEVLPRCKAEGSYGFVGIAPTTDVVQVESADELQANMPGSADLGGKLGKGEVWDLALIVGGKRRTVVRDLTREQISGNCAGATHFVRTAYVGGYAMNVGKAGQSAGATALFEGAPASQKSGDMKSCYNASPQSTAAPQKCSAAVRLELRSIGEISAERDEARALEGGDCPDGTVMSKGFCSLKGGTHVCNPEDGPACEAQCAKGDALSCGYLGYLHVHGLSSRTKDAKKGAELYQRSCDAGEQFGCYGLGWLIEHGQGGKTKSFPEATELFVKACDAGVGRACLRLGVQYDHGQGMPKNTSMSERIYERSCNAGVAEGCASKGYRAEQRNDDTQAFDYYERGCQGDSPLGCNNLGWAYQSGRGVPKDAMQAVMIYERACAELSHKLGETHGAGLACNNIGIMYEQGVPGVVDGPRAFTYFEKSCMIGSGWGCHNSFNYAAWGKLEVAPDETAARKLGKRGCFERSHPETCLRLGEWHQSVGRTSEARVAFKKGCALGNSTSCTKASAL